MPYGHGGYVSCKTYNAIAFVPIPIGYRATHVMVYCDLVTTVNVYECDIHNTAAASRGSGNTNTEINITDVNSNSTNYLSIDVDDLGSTSYAIAGGYITIEPIP